MIKLKKRPATPPTLVSDPVVKLKDEFHGCVAKGEHIASGRFTPHWSKTDVKEALYQMHRGKCCYCERRRDERREPDVEHYRPKAEVSGCNHPGYWWLAYDWSNYFFSCKKCNQEHKKNQFPLLDESKRAMRPLDDLANERPYLINPEIEDPEQYITYDWQRAYGRFVKAIGLDDEGRGDRTIKIIGLNQGAIPKERAELVKILEEIAETMVWALREDKQGAIERTANVIKEETCSEKTFAGFRRAFFRGHGLDQYVSQD